MRPPLKKDMLVTLTGDVDLYPYATLKAGELGTVLWADYDDDGLAQLELRMEDHHYGLRLWDNCAILVGAAAAMVQAIAPECCEAMLHASSLLSTVTTLAV